MSDPPPPRYARARWWLVPAFLMLMSISTPVAAGLLAGALVVKLGARAFGRGLPRN